MHAGASCMGQIRPTHAAIAQNVHFNKTMNAAAKLADLIQLPTPLGEHTPFFICAVALSAMINIAAHALLLDSGRVALSKQRIVLATGALGVLSATWAVAGEVLKDVKGVARTTFGSEPLIGASGDGDIDLLAESFGW